MDVFQSPFPVDPGLKTKIKSYQHPIKTFMERHTHRTAYKVGKTYISEGVPTTICVNL